MGGEDASEVGKLVAIVGPFVYLSYMTVATLNNHIVLNENGVPIIRDTTTKVVEIVLDVKAYGWSPEEIHYQYPYLSMAQIHSALAFYWEDPDYFEIDIARRTRIVDEIRRKTKANSIRPLLKKKGAI